MNQEEKAIIDLVINGQQAKTSLKEISTSVIALRREVMKMHEADDPALYAKKVGELKKVTAAQAAMTAGMKTQISTWEKVKSQIGSTAIGVVGGNFMTSAIQGLMSFIPNMLSKMGELSDSFADIRKTTGMSGKEVAVFNSELKKIDTRTPAKDLREIAVVAGQLGIAKEDILGFTSSVDKLNVALGDEFLGGASEVADVTGKLRNIFKDIKSDNIGQDMLHIGNALNELGATGAATGPVVADIANRIGGAGIQMGLTTAQVLGLSATLQELNVESERGGTAVTKILQKMLTHVDDFARVAGVSTDTFKKKLDTDLYGAFIQVVKAAGQSSSSSTRFAETLQSMGIEASGAMEVISKLSGNTDLLKARVDLAGTAITETSSIMSEFNLKNNNLAANMEKLSKRFASWWDKSAIMGFFEGLIGAMADTRSEAEKLAGAYAEQKGEVDSLETKMNPLIARHEELTKKGKLNKTEQSELKKIISQIAGTIPLAVTQWDALGNAMGINTTKAKEYIEQQKLLLRYKNQEAIIAQKDEIKLMQSKFELQNKLVNSKEKYISGGAYGGVGMHMKMSNEELASEVKKMVELDNLLKGAKLNLAELNGESWGTPAASAAPPEKTLVGAPGNFMSKEQESAAKKAEAERKKAANKAKKEADDLAKDLLKIQEELFIASLEKNDAEVEAVQQKYAKLRTEAKGNREALAQIDNLEAQDFTALMKKQVAEAEKLAKEKTAALLKEKLDAGEEIYQATLSDAAKEELAVDQLYEHLILMADKFGFDTTSIYQKWADAKTKIYTDAADKEKTKDNERAQGRKDFYRESAQVISNAIFSIGANNRKANEDAELASIDKKRNAELANKHLTEKQKAEINAKYDRQQRAIKLKAWKADRMAHLEEAIMNGAIAAIAAWKNPLAAPFTLPLIAIATAAGVTTIMNQKTPEFAAGGFTSLKQSNNAQGYVTTPTLFNGKYIAGEKDGEWIASGAMLRNPYTANIIGSLEALQRQGPGAIQSAGANTTGPQQNGYDFRRLETLLGGVIEAQKSANDKKVIFSHTDYDTSEAKRVQIRNDVNA